MAERFEDLRAWQTARRLTNEIYDVTDGGAFGDDWTLKDQIRHAAISVMSNIAPHEYFLPSVGAGRDSRVERGLASSIFSDGRKPLRGKSVSNS
jgi:hypothetical protein